MNFNEERYLNLSFKEKLSLLRAERSLTQTELARAVGISQRQIAAYESGESKPRMGTLLKLASVLNVTYSWLGEEVINMEPISFPATSERLVKKEIPLIKKDFISFWVQGRGRDECIEGFIYTYHKLSDHAFALKIDDPAMISNGVSKYSFPR